MFLLIRLLLAGPADVYARVLTAPPPAGSFDSWLESPTVRLLSESPGHFPLLAELVRSAHVGGSQIHDAKIAAICLSHGVRELLLRVVIRKI